MVIYLAEKPFKDREEVKARIKLCGNWSAICGVLAFLLVIIGVIGDTLNRNLGLVQYLVLQAIFFTVISISPYIHLAVYKYLCGIESERKNMLLIPLYLSSIFYFSFKLWEKGFIPVFTGKN